MIEEKRREDLRMRAANRSRARTHRQGRAARPGPLQRPRVALTATVITVVVVMFEILAWLVGG